MTDQKKGVELKELDLSKSEFTANGNRYLIEDKLSSERFFLMKECEIEIGFGMSYDLFFAKLQELRGHLNQGNFVDSAVLVHQMETGIANAEQRKTPVMRYCAMFINREDEDRRKIDDDLIDQKIADWEEEGIEFRSFFLLAGNMVNTFKENYTDPSINTSIV